MKAIYKFNVPVGFKPNDCSHCNLWHQYSMGVGGCSISKFTHSKFGETPICPLKIEIENDWVYCTQCKHFYIDGDEVPHCIHEHECDIEDCEDSAPMLDCRPFSEPINVK